MENYSKHEHTGTVNPVREGETPPVANMVAGGRRVILQDKNLGEIRIDRVMRKAVAKWRRG